jgi:GTP-binding protein
MAFDLFVELGATEEQCEFPIIYACAREGWGTDDPDEIQPILSGEKKGTLKPLFDKILNDLPGPEVDMDADFKMQLSSLAWSDYVGQLAVGRVVSGRVRKNDQIFCIGETAPGVIQRKQFQVTRVSKYVGNREEECDELQAGEIGILAGCNEISIGDTIAGNKDTTPYPRISVDAPTLRMIFTINTGPMSGKEGEAIQSRKLKERLLRECRSNVAIRYEDGETSEQFFLLGRGELQFSILIEQMRREGLEFMVGKPVVLMKTDDQGSLLEPIENAVLDLPSAHSGEVTELFHSRKGLLASYENMAGDRIRLIFEIPSRGLLGIRTHYLTATRGQGLFSSEIKGYEPHRGEMVHRKNGSLVADRAGKTTDYALVTLEELGMLFIGQGIVVYEGMIVGECSRANDVNINPTKEKKLTNMRKTGSDGLTILSGTRDMNLEACIEWIEVTPLTVRLRKKVLQQNQRSVIRGKKK